MKYCGFLILLIFLLVGCKQNSQSDAQSDTATTQIESAKKVEVDALPSIPEELFKQIFMECDFVDYIFYELPFSISYDQQTSIQSALQWVDQSSEIPTVGCKALGRMIFQKAGEIMIEAELYVSPSCSYYKWIQNGKPVYDNLMSNKGIIHYAGIIQQFENQNQ